MEGFMKATYRDSQLFWYSGPHVRDEEACCIDCSISSGDTKKHAPDIIRGSIRLIKEQI